MYSEKVWYNRPSSTVTHHVTVDLHSFLSTFDVDSIDAIWACTVVTVDFITVTWFVRRKPVLCTAWKVKTSLQTVAYVRCAVDVQTSTFFWSRKSPDSSLWYILNKSLLFIYLFIAWFTHTLSHSLKWRIMQVWESHVSLQEGTKRCEITRRLLVITNKKWTSYTCAFEVINAAYWAARMSKHGT